MTPWGVSDGRSSVHVAGRTVVRHGLFGLGASGFTAHWFAWVSPVTLATIMMTKRAFEARA